MQTETNATSDTEKVSENVGIEPKRDPKKKARECETVTKREPKRSQRGTRMKKARPKTTFAEQDCTNLETGCEKDHNVCQKVATMKP